MENEKAIEIFNKWMDCKDAYQADPSCDGNCFSCEYYASAEEEKEAMQIAISALEKQEQTKEAIPHRNLHGGRNMIVYCDADDCKWNEDGKCKGPVQPAGHTALYIRQNWHGWQQCDDFKDKAEEDND